MLVLVDDLISEVFVDLLLLLGLVAGVLELLLQQLNLLLLLSDQVPLFIEFLLLVSVSAVRHIQLLLQLHFLAFDGGYLLDFNFQLVFELDQVRLLLLLQVLDLAFLLEVLAPQLLDEGAQIGDLLVDVLDLGLVLQNFLLGLIQVSEGHFQVAVSGFQLTIKQTLFLEKLVLLRIELIELLRQFVVFLGYQCLLFEQFLGKLSTSLRRVRVLRFELKDRDIHLSDLLLEFR